MKTIYHFNRILTEPKSLRLKNHTLVFSLFCMFLLNAGLAKAQNPSVTLDTQGVLAPRMTAAQRSPGIANPATGLLVYQTDGASGFYYNAGTPGTPNWVKINSDLGMGSVFFTNTTNPDTQVIRQVPIPYTPTNAITIMPVACTCTAIYLEDETFTPAGATSCTATLYKNNAATPLTVTVVSGAAQGNKTVGIGTSSVAVAAGDKLTIGISSVDPTKYIKMNVSLYCR